MNILKLRGGLSAILMFCLVFPFFAQTNANETFVICSGESIFLEAFQSFAQGPQPPQGVSQCFPQLHAIEINTTTNVSQVEKRGFTVSPQETTIYEVTSIPTCGPPGFGGVIGPAPGAAIRTYEVIVDATCQSAELPTVFEDYPWLTDIVNPNDCGNTRIEVYQSGIYTYVMVRTVGVQGTLYNQDGLFYCDQTANYDCIAAYNLTQQIDNWTCITGVSCPAVYEPVCGIDGNTYGNACEAVVAGVEIAYQGECSSVQPPINCEGFTGTVIQNDCGTFIQTEESASTGSLISPFYEEGVIIPSVGDLVEFSFRALGAADNFCLGRPTTAGRVTCLKIVGATNPESSIFNDYPWLSEQVNLNSCTNEKVEVYQSGIYFYLLVTDANGQATLYNQNGQFYCQQSFSYNCVVAYNLGDPIDTWRCPTGINEAVIIRTAACIGERFEFNYPPLCNGRQIETPTTNDIIDQIGIIGSTNTVIATLKNYGSFERYHLVTNDAGGCDRVLHIYEMVEREDCDFGPPPSGVPAVYEDFPWLREVLPPIECESTNGEKIIFFNNDPSRGASNSTALEMYQSGGFIYFLVQYEPSIHATLYSQDGSLLCTNSIGYDCVEAYGLGNPVASWRCVNPFFFPCTDDISPVCGSDGRTYTNECEAQRAGVEVVTTGECPNVPPEAPDEIFFDYPWLTDIINPNACTSEKVAVYQSGIYFYLLVTDASGKATLYNQDGLFYCQQSTNYDCVAAYNLGQPIDTWQCNLGLGCPAVVMPGCGVDGNTYDINPCVMSNGNIEIAYRGTCDPGPVVCDMFSGRVIENECGLFIVVGQQYWRPIFLDGVIVPSARDFVEFAFFPRSLSDYPDDGCLTSPNGTPPIVGVVSCLNVTDQVNFKETFTICSGESIFLKARNGFPAGTGDACGARKEDISIFPSTNATKEELTGYTVSPTVSTIYAVETIASCNFSGPVGPGPDGEVGLPTPPIAIDYYQVIVEEDCDSGPSAEDFYPEDCSTISNPIRGKGTIVENACGLAIDLDDDGQFTAVVKPHFSSCNIDFSAPVGTRVEVDYKPIPINLDCGGFEIVVIRISIIENNGCNQYTGIYSYDECNKPQVRVTKADGSEVVFEPYFPTADLIPPIGAKIQFNIENELEVASLCNGQETPVIIGVVTCSEVIEEDAEPCNEYTGIFLNDPCLGIIIQSTQPDGSEVLFYPIIEEQDIPPVGSTIQFNINIVREEAVTTVCEGREVQTIFGEVTCTKMIEEGQLDCTNMTGTIFFRNCDDGREFYFIETNDGRIFDPYLDPTISYTPIDGQTVNFGYIDATFDTPCSLAEKAIAITCIEIAENIVVGNCSRFQGEIFFENCDDGREFYFIKTNTGEILDPYFTQGIDFVKYPGKKVQFDFVPADFASPCSIADQAVLINCIEEMNTSEVPPSPIFLDYPWLSDVVDPNNCKGEKITFYQSGSYQFLFIEVNGIGTLYFQDGARYCQSSPTYDCVAIYNLGNPVDFWECGQNYKEEATERKEIEITQLEGFVAYPNPTLGTLQVQLPILKNSAELRISNLFGQQLMERIIPATSFTQTMELDLSNYQNGIYYLELRTKGRRGIQKIIKQDLH